MFKKIITGMIILAGSMMLFACARVVPVRNFDNQPVPAHLTSQQVGQTILRATNGRRYWRATQVKPGVIRATVFVRDHKATVLIPYSNTSYSIEYQSSYNLMAHDGLIHRNYNKWVILLNRDIQHDLN